MPGNTLACLEVCSFQLTESERALSLGQIEVQDARNSTTGSWDAKIYELTQAVAAVDKNSLASISRIPDTVLADIFFAALTSCNSQGQHAILQAISSTSHCWRVLALNTPKLWCDIVIRDSALDLSRTLAYLDRSADALLDFTILATPHDRIESMEIHELLQWTAPYLQRCKTLTIVTNEYQDARSLFPIKYPMPRLRRFTWEHTGTERPAASEAPIIVLDGSACSPASVHVQMPVGSDISYSVRSGLAVRNLSFEGGDVRTMTELMEVLPTYPKLRSLLLALDHVDLQAEEPSFLGLRSDSVEVIRIVPYLNIPHIFDHMNTPCLEHLVLSRSLSPMMGIQRDIGPFPLCILYAAMPPL
ncbi:hypothetical protein BS47DRAFT_1186232 [Hydnum rufescens UP504]|uniref:F-box domain-containing protein n=1 Tax=Hydnum rufescens UP504 TaxID=1448309 RepID=A0A9P6DU85_9AGAM|nr:hypothetical protein BS47DRAFT_1186232 [Hydnum rufescens UP504]